MPKKQYRCSDGFCGADDCTRCHPEWQGYEPEDDDQDAVSVVGWGGSTTDGDQDD